MLSRISFVALVLALLPVTGSAWSGGGGSAVAAPQAQEPAMPQGPEASRGDCREPPCPKLHTSSCSPIDPYWAHLFDRGDLRMARRNDDIQGLIGHGWRKDVRGFDPVKQEWELVPVFVAPQREDVKLSLEDVEAILKGRITNWRELGSEEGEIHLYLHGGELQSQAFERFLKLQANRERLPPEIRAFRIPGYEALETAASDDANALVIGLRSYGSEVLSIIPVEGKTIYQSAEYPLRVPVTYYVREGLKEPVMLIEEAGLP